MPASISQFFEGCRIQLIRPHQQNVSAGPGEQAGFVLVRASRPPQ
jgi:hypothetical protein